MNATRIQKHLIDLIRTKIPPGESLPKTIAECLNVSLDAAYKRIAGQRILDLQELNLILQYFKLSLSDIEAEMKTNGMVWFRFKPIGYNGYGYKDYLKTMIQNLEFLVANNTKHIVYSAKEVPMFYNFLSPELGCFKSFVWQKSILCLPEFSGKKFSLDQLDEEIIDLGKRVLCLYSQIPSKEIWNYETVNCTIRQIAYYKEAGLFTTENCHKIILQRYAELIDFIEQQADASCKLNPYTNTQAAPYSLYSNELILGDNTALVEFNNGMMHAFITPNAVNSFTTTSPEVTSYIYNNLDGLLKKSIRINRQNEKLKGSFFGHLRQSFAEVQG